MRHSLFTVPLSLSPSSVPLSAVPLMSELKRAPHIDLLGFSHKNLQGKSVTICLVKAASRAYCSANHKRPRKKEGCHYANLKNNVWELFCVVSSVFLARGPSTRKNLCFDWDSAQGKTRHPKMSSLLLSSQLRLQQHCFFPFKNTLLLGFSVCLAVGQRQRAKQWSNW